MRGAVEPAGPGDRYPAEDPRIRSAALHGSLSIQAASGSAVVTLWEEPQYGPWVSESQNWCGPGSTAAVIGNWNSRPQTFSDPTYGSGGQGYLTWLAKHGVAGIGPMVVTNPSTGLPITYDTTERNTLNNQTNSLFYVIQNPVGNLTNFIAYINADLNPNSGQHPLVSIVKTSGLPGWATYQVDHYQVIAAFDDASNYIQFGDTAGPNSNPFGDPFGWHTTVSLSDYYLHVQQSFDEIIW